MNAAIRWQKSCLRQCGALERGKMSCMLEVMAGIGIRRVAAALASVRYGKRAR